MRQSIVQLGYADDGEATLNMQFLYPEPHAYDMRPSDRQLAAIGDFYAFDPADDLTEYQAHCLLAYRDYARAAVDRLFPRAGEQRRWIIARCIAAFIGSSDSIRNDVRSWADERWRRGTSSPPDRSISRTRHFPAVERFVQDMLADLSAQGVAL